MQITSLHSWSSLWKHFANVQSIIKQMKAGLTPLQVSACTTNFRELSVTTIDHSLAETFFIIKLPHYEWLANKRFVYIERPRCSNFPLFYIPSALREMKRDGRSWNFDHCVRSEEMKVFSFSIRACVTCQLAVSTNASASGTHSEGHKCLFASFNCFLNERSFKGMSRLI